jgi:hypothetical protein
MNIVSSVALEDFDWNPPPKLRPTFLPSIVCPYAVTQNQVVS